MRRSVATFATIVALAAALSGCGDAGSSRVAANTSVGASTSHAGTGSPPVTVTPRPHRAGADYDPRTYANSPLPLDAYRLSPAEQATISTAATVVANRCRQRYGFAPTLAPYRALHPDDQLARRYSAVRGVKTARTYGYHVATTALATPSAPATPASTDENLVNEGTADGSDDPTARPSRKVNGLSVPQGGCVYEGIRAVGQVTEGESPELWPDTVQHDVFTRMLADPRVRVVVGKWSDCMHDAGFAESDPLNVHVDITTPTPSPGEIEQATVDAGCAHKARLFDTSLAVEVELQRVAIATNLDRLTAARALVLSELENAHRLLASAK